MRGQGPWRGGGGAGGARARLLRQVAEAEAAPPETHIVVWVITALLATGLMVVLGIRMHQLEHAPGPTPTPGPTANVVGKTLRARRLGIAYAEYVFEFEVTAVGRIEGMRVPSQGALPHMAVDRVTHAMLCCAATGAGWRCGSADVVVVGNSTAGTAFAEVSFDAPAPIPTVCRLSYGVMT